MRDIELWQGDCLELMKDIPDKSVESVLVRKGEIMSVFELCDVCHAKEPSKKFKVKMSRKGCYQRTGYGIRWTDMWQPYKTISICEDCAEKLLGIKSNKTFVKEIVEAHKKH